MCGEVESYIDRIARLRLRRDNDIPVEYLDVVTVLADGACVDVQAGGHQAHRLRVEEARDAIAPDHEVLPGAVAIGHDAPDGGAAVGRPRGDGRGGQLGIGLGTDVDVAEAAGEQQTGSADGRLEEVVVAEPDGPPVEVLEEGRRAGVDGRIERAGAVLHGGEVRPHRHHVVEWVERVVEVGNELERRHDPADEGLPVEVEGVLGAAVVAGLRLAGVEVVLALDVVAEGERAELHRQLAAGQPAGGELGGECRGAQLAGAHLERGHAEEGRGEGGREEVGRRHAVVRPRHPGRDPRLERVPTKGITGVYAVEGRVRRECEGLLLGG